MPMSGSVLGAAIKSAIDALTDEQKQDRDQLFEAMGNAIVTHIRDNAVVTVTSVSGVTTGAGVSGPGAGTIA